MLSQILKFKYFDFSKEKKEIRWLGLPTNSIQEANNLELEKARRIERIKAKTQQLQDLILQVS